MNATYSIWKPVDMFSAELVRIAKNKLDRNLKVGHAGTLDPFAEGVLVLCFGDHTKHVPKIMAMQKEYKAKISLGIETDTLDKTGQIYKTSEIPKLSKDEILGALSGFIGYTDQTPPAFSALKLNGKCLYEYARQGIRIIKKPREVYIKSIDLVDFEIDSITIKVICGSGTYIRSLASDVAKKLGTSGHLSSLERLSVGEYNKKNSLSLEAFLDADIKR